MKLTVVAQVLSVLVSGVLQGWFVARLCSVRRWGLFCAVYVAGLAVLAVLSSILGPLDTVVQIVLLTAVAFLWGADISLSLCTAVLSVTISYLSTGMMNSVESMILPAVRFDSIGLVLLLGVGGGACACIASYALAFRSMCLVTSTKLPKVWLLVLPVLFVLMTEVFVTFFGYSTVETGLDPEALTFHAAMLVLQFGGLAAVLSMLVAYGYLVHGMNVENDVRLLRQANRAERARVRESDILLSRTRSLRHDWRNHIATVQGLIGAGKMEEAAEYLREMQGAVAEASPAHWTGNAVVDALIRTKSALAAEQGTVIDILPCAIPDGAVDDFDLCIVVGNALDNALEACAACDGKAWIEMGSTHQGDFLVLHFRNSCRTDVCSREQEWGTGLSNVAKIAEKYGGTAELHLADGVAALNVLLSISGQELSSSIHVH